MAQSVSNHLLTVPKIVSEFFVVALLFTIKCHHFIGRMECIANVSSLLIDVLYILVCAPLSSPLSTVELTMLLSLSES